MLRIYPITRPNLLTVIDACTSSVTSLPASYLFGGTASALRTLINGELLQAKSALAAEDDALALDHLTTSIALIETHVSVSCPERWLITNLESIIDFIGLASSTTTTTTTTTSPTTSSTTSPTPTNPGPLSPWAPVLVIELVAVVIVLAYYFRSKRD